MDNRQSVLSGGIRPAVHMKCDARVGQGVAGEFDTFTLQSLLYSGQDLCRCRWNTGLEFISFYRCRSNATAPGKLYGTPTKHGSGCLDLLNRDHYSIFKYTFGIIKGS